MYGLKIIKKMNKNKKRISIAEEVTKYFKEHNIEVTKKNMDKIKKHIKLKAYKERKLKKKLDK